MNSIRELPPEYLNSCPVIDQKYKVLFKLGSGRFSKVKMAIKLDTHERVAVKIMNEKLIENNQSKYYQQNALRTFLNEIRMCIQAKHRYIIQIIDFKVGGIYRTSDGRVRRILYYVMKMASNGQLFRLIKETEIFSQKIARYIFRQLIAGVQHLHNQGISHRDIKAQNILIDAKMNIKIADFGYSCYFLDSHSQKISFDASDAVGSLKCNAPQLTNCQNQGSYHADQIDLFACGCLLFQMVMKSPPFKSSNYKDQFYHQLMKNDKKQFWDIFSANCCPSPDFRDLIQKLLNPNPKVRLDLKGVKQHPWFLGQIATRNQYRKDLSLKLKKVTIKIRKQQQQQIKIFFKKQKTKSQISQYKLQDIYISRQFQKDIIELGEFMHMNQISHSDSSSNIDCKQYKQEQEKIILAKNSDNKPNSTTNQ